MKRRLTLLAGCLALSLAFLVMVVSARLGGASGPPARPKDAEEAPRIATSKITHATEKGKLDADAAIALAKYLMEGRVEKAKQIVALQEQIQVNSESMEFANRRMRNLTSGTSKIERDAVIVVDKVNNGGGKVK